MKVCLRGSQEILRLFLPYLRELVFFNLRILALSNFDRIITMFPSTRMMIAGFAAAVLSFSVLTDTVLVMLRLILELVCHEL